MGSIKLRRWQHQALTALEATGADNFLAVATPGAGKTTFALVTCLRMLANMPQARLVVVAPTAHLKTQWAEAAAGFGIHLIDNWDGHSLPQGVHGVATTYQQVASKPGAFARASFGGIAVFDEVHHAGTDRAWGDALLAAFTHASKRLTLSGTPFRTDANPIPFVHYDEDGMSHADVTYGYADALDDRVVRPVRFQVVGGQASWVANDGERIDASMEEILDKSHTSQRLRTAVAASGEWLPRTLAMADETLTQVRADHPDAGALALAVDQEHARTIARMLERMTGERATIVLSDDPNASDHITKFSGGNSRWLVAVRMVSEGVDVPRLRVGVWATTTSTELFFRQAVGRLVRVGRGPYGESVMFLPRDPRLVSYAAGIKEERRHQLKPKDVKDELAEANRERSTADQMYEALGSAAGEATAIHSGGDASAVDSGADSGAGSGAVEVDLPKLQVPGSAMTPTGSAKRGPDGGGHRSYSDLRGANSRAVAKLARMTGTNQRSVNAALNEQVGVVSVTTASVEQLERRLDVAKKWLDRAGGQGQLHIPAQTSTNAAPGGVWMRG